MLERVAKESDREVCVLEGPINAVRGPAEDEGGLGCGVVDLGVRAAECA